MVASPRYDFENMIFVILQVGFYFAMIQPRLHLNHLLNDDLDSFVFMLPMQVNE